MAYTALQLINRAYNLSQVVARDLQVTSGSEVEDGLFLLNALLDIKASDLRLIPYFQEYIFNAVAGQETYFVPNLLFVDTMTFNIGVIRYSMTDLTRREYFATPRVDNIQTLPFSYHVERCLGGANIYLYFEPASNYVLKVWGKFGLQDVTLTTDLSTIYDPFYIEYLRYGLAEYICENWGTTFPDEAKRKYMEIRKKLMDINPPDLSSNKRSYFKNGYGLDWATINLTTGYVPF